MGKRTPGRAEVQEDKRHQALLAKVTEAIDRFAETNAPRESLCEALDWMAHFTREHFGFQRRLLDQCSGHRDYLFRRAEVHAEFRRQLTQICLDMMRGDRTVPERLRSLCHQLLDDAQAQGQVLSDLMRGSHVKVRRKPRHDQLESNAPRVC